MRKDEVKTGGIYAAKVSGQVVRVKILGPRLFTKGWDAQNLKTGRDIWIKTAARLREEVN
jgi:hypothetical protein